MRRRTLVLFGVYALVAGALACSSAKPATPVAPTSSGPSAATDGSTLKTSTPAAPVAVERREADDTTVVLTCGRIDAPVRRRRAAAVSLPGDEPGGHGRGRRHWSASPTWQVTPRAQRVQHAPHVAGPCGVPRRGGTVVRHHVLHHGGTVHHRRSAHERQDGRQADRRRVRCRRLAVAKPDRRHRLRRADLRRAAGSSSTLTNVGPTEGFTIERDLKMVSMGDATTFGSFGAFRDHPWKMHLVQRADFPSGWEIIWRNGGTDPEGDPGDHRIKLNVIASHHATARRPIISSSTGTRGDTRLPSMASRSCRMGGTTGTNRRTSACRSAATRAAIRSSGRSTGT